MRDDERRSPLCQVVQTASRIFTSVSVSIFDVASSKITIGGSFSKTRAIDTRCFWPTDNFTPRSPIQLSYPSGSRLIKSCARAARAAASTRSWSAAVAVQNIFPHRAVEEKRFLLHQTDLASQEGQRQIRTSYPSIKTVAALHVVKPHQQLEERAFPAPLGPTKAIAFPGLRPSRLTSDNTGHPER